jgi:two-component system, NarL family, invasion response regulator UvrY
MIRILVADDHPIIRQGIIRIIQDMPDVSVTGEAGSGREVLEKIRANRYELVILDISMPDINGLDVLIELKKNWQNTPVLILTMHPERNYAIKMFKAGASGYLTKDKAPYELVEAIQTIVAGKKFVSHDFIDQINLNTLSFNDYAIENPLSNREFQIMSMVAAGKTVKEIADTLSLSVKTVSTHRSHILEKLQLKNNAEIMRYALENHITL